MTSGSGYIDPGLYFIYDSEHLQELSYTIQTLTKQLPAAWAKSRFAAPLGIPNLYAWEGLEGQISAGGGQMVTCRQMARLGQLILNRGAWPSSSSFKSAAASASGVAAAKSVEQLIPSSYVSDMLKAHYPNAAANYGLLTWLNSPAIPGVTKECCMPRWCNESGPLIGSMIGEDYTTEQIAPVDTAVALGYLGRHMYVIPSRNMTVVSFANAWGTSSTCDMRKTPGAYDEAFTMSSILKMLKKAITPTGETEAKMAPTHQYQRERRSTLDAASKPSSPSSLAQRPHWVPEALGPRRNAFRNKFSQKAHHIDRALLSAATSSTRAANGGRNGQASGGSASSSSATGGGGSGVGGGGGACYCYCPPVQGFGHCFEAQSENDCYSHYPEAGAHCPELGVGHQCTLVDPLPDCPALGPRIEPRTKGFNESSCVAGPRCSGTAPFSSTWCACKPAWFDGCTYVPGASCNVTPYFPNIAAAAFTAPLAAVPSSSQP